MNFKAGDIIRMKEPCSFLNAGEICTLYGDDWGELFANTEENKQQGHDGCSCQSNWEFISEEVDLRKPIL